MFLQVAVWTVVQRHESCMEFDKIFMTLNHLKLNYCINSANFMDVIDLRMSCKILAGILEYKLYEMHTQRHVNIGTIYENIIVKN